MRPKVDPREQKKEQKETVQLDLLNEIIKSLNTEIKTKDREIASTVDLIRTETENRFHRKGFPGH